MARRGVLFFIIWIVCAAVAFGQSDDDAVWQEVLEQWAEQNDSETVPDDYLEQLQYFAESPINLNDTSSDLLQELLFLSDFQRASLKAYIAQNGPMASLAELYFVNGFDSMAVAMLRHFVKAEPVEDEDFGLWQMLRHARSGLTVGTKRVMPSSRGYEEEKYEGSPFRYYFKYNLRYSDRVDFQFSGENDAGEALAFGNVGGVRRMGLDSYGYHLMLKNFGRLKRAVVGKYQLQFGQGVTLWSGFAPWLSGGMSLRRYGAGIKSASAFSEYGYMRGAAATVSLLPKGNGKTLGMTLFYSCVNRDATLATADSSDGAEPVYQSIYQSGLHRTELELSKKDCLNEQLIGGHLQYGNGRLVVGGTAYATLFANELRPVDYAYNSFAFRGKHNFNYGLDATYKAGNVLLFGEAAMSYNESSKSLVAESGWLPLAAIGGMQVQMGDNSQMSLAYRYGSPTYQNLYANMLGQGSSVGNVSGMILSFNTRLPFYINLQSYADFFRYPYMRYRIYSPSTGVEYRLKLSKELVTNTVLDCQYRYKVSQRNTEGQLYSVVSVMRQQVQATLDYNAPSGWRFVSRVMFSWFEEEGQPVERGSLIFQEVSYRREIKEHPLIVGLRLSLFDISDYDARLYAYESDLMYEYSVPLFNGRGVRSYLICRYEISSRLSFAVKYALSYYPEQESVGSGYDAIADNKKQEVKVQLRWHF